MIIDRACAGGGGGGENVSIIVHGPSLTGVQAWTGFHPGGAPLERDVSPRRSCTLVVKVDKNGNK